MSADVTGARCGVAGVIPTRARRRGRRGDPAHYVGALGAVAPRGPTARRRRPTALRAGPSAPSHRAGQRPGVADRRRGRSAQRSRDSGRHSSYTALGPAFMRLRRTPPLSPLGVHETRARRRHRPRDPCIPLEDRCTPPGSARPRGSRGRRPPRRRPVPPACRHQHRAGTGTPARHPARHRHRPAWARHRQPAGMPPAGPGCRSASTRLVHARGGRGRVSAGLSAPSHRAGQRPCVTDQSAPRAGQRPGHRAGQRPGVAHQQLRAPANARALGTVAPRGPTARRRPPTAPRAGQRPGLGAVAPRGPTARRRQPTAPRRDQRADPRRRRTRPGVAHQQLRAGQRPDLGPSHRAGQRPGVADQQLRACRVAPRGPTARRRRPTAPRTPGSSTPSHRADQRPGVDQQLRAPANAQVLGAVAPRRRRIARANMARRTTRTNDPASPTNSSAPRPTPGSSAPASPTNSTAPRPRRNHTARANGRHRHQQLRTATNARIGPSHPRASATARVPTAPSRGSGQRPRRRCCEAQARTASVLIGAAPSATSTSGASCRD